MLTGAREPGADGGFRKAEGGVLTLEQAVALALK